MDFQGMGRGKLEKLARAVTQRPYGPHIDQSMIKALYSAYRAQVAHHIFNAEAGQPWQDYEEAYCRAEGNATLKRLALYIDP